MRRTIFVLLCLVAVGMVGLATGTLGNAEKAKPALPVAANPTATPQGQNSDDPPGTIDGSKNPELIPDHVAYSILFRLISDRNTDEEKGRVRAYIRQIILKCRGCGKQKEESQQGEPDDVDAEALVAVAEKFHQRAKGLEKQAAEIKGRKWPEPDPAVAAKLRVLQRQNEDLAMETAYSLPNHLSAAGLDKVRQHVNEYVKRRIKIVPGPEPNLMEHGQHH